MAILVSGGAGYIGAHIALELAAHGEEAIIVDNFSTTPRRRLPFPIVEGDIGDAQFVAHAVGKFQINEVIHLAGRIVVEESLQVPLDYYRANTLTTLALLEAAVQTGVKRIVFSSTAAIYGNPLTSPVSEDAAPNPLSPYGSSKLMSEWMLRDCSRAHPINYASLRYFNVVGADPAGRVGQTAANATHLLKVAVQTALGKRSEVTVFGTDYGTPDGTCIRDYIHVSDLASAHLAVLRYLRSEPTNLVLNCGYGHGHSVLEVLASVKRVSGHDFPVVYGPRRPGDPTALIADTSRLRRLLGWVPRYDNLDVICRDALAWERKITTPQLPSSVNSLFANST